jgi:hypothetical protein
MELVLKIVFQMLQFWFQRQNVQNVNLRADIARLKHKYGEIRNRVLLLQMQIAQVDSQIIPGQVTSFTDRFVSFDLGLLCPT